MSGWYNGYSPSERSKKGRRRAVENREPRRGSACEMCGDSSRPVRFHSEDYSEPYTWRGNCRDRRLLCQVITGVRQCLLNGVFLSETSAVGARDPAPRNTPPSDSGVL
jgi:hypothetical protein